MRFMVDDGASSLSNRAYILMSCLKIGKWIPTRRLSLNDALESEAMYCKIHKVQLC